jgi:hypothetical protein
LTGLDKSVLQIKTKIVNCHTADSKPVKQEVNGTVILPPLVFPGGSITVLLTSCLAGLDNSVLQIKTKIVSCHTADSKTSQTEGQRYSDTSPLNIPCLYYKNLMIVNDTTSWSVTQESSIMLLELSIMLLENIYSIDREY